MKEVNTSAVARLICLVTVLFWTGCNSTNETPDQSPLSSGAQQKSVESAVASANPEPKTFNEQLEHWKERWAGAAPVPECSGLFANAADAQPCAHSIVALSTLQQSVSNQHEHAVLIKKTGDLLLATQSAAEHFQELVRPGDPGRTSDEPGPSEALKLIARQYTLTNHMAMRYLALFLQSAPPQVRAAALSEFERILQAKPHWRVLHRVLQDSVNNESDAELKAKMTALVLKFRRKTPARSGTPAAK